MYGNNNLNNNVKFTEASLQKTTKRTYNIHGEQVMQKDRN